MNVLLAAKMLEGYNLEIYYLYKLRVYEWAVLQYLFLVTFHSSRVVCSMQF